MQAISILDNHPCLPLDRLGGRQCAVAQATLGNLANLISLNLIST
jgi:hypothetical protein